VLGRIWKNGNRCAPLVGIQIEPLWKTVVPQKQRKKIELSYDPGIPLLSVYPKDMKPAS